MRKILIKKNNIPAAFLEESEGGFYFKHLDGYSGYPVSMTLQLGEEYFFDKFPAFLSGLLPEGIILQGLLKREKIDRDDLMAQLIAVGEDLVGDLTVEKVQDE